MSTVLIGYGSIEGQTRKICQRVAQKVEALGHRTVLVDTTERSEKEEWPNPDAVIIGAPIHEHHYPAAVRRYIKAHSEAMSKPPGMFLSVSLAVMSDEEDDKTALQHLASSFLESVGWQPADIHQIAGALKYTEYNFFKRFIMKQILRAAGGPTDTHQDYEFTDWEALEKNVEDFVRTRLEPSAAA